MSKSFLREWFRQIMSPLCILMWVFSGTVIGWGFAAAATHGRGFHLG